MKISVCIPCHINDFEDLKKLIINLNSQSRKPDEVIIFIKPVNKNFLDNKNLFLDKEINYQIITDSKYSTMGYGKNRCIEKATGDIICLMDSDDTVHFSKIEFVEKFMKNNLNCDIMVHGYHYNDIDALNNLKINLEDESYSACHADPKTLGITTSCGSELHHAHASFRRDVIKNNMFPEENIAYRIDDSVMLKLLLKKNYNIFFSKHKFISFNNI